MGKSSLAVQFCDEHFVDSYYPTIEEQFSKEFKYKGKEYLLEIQDTAGHDEFSILNPKYAIGVNGYIIVYSVASRASFEMVPIIRDKILSYSSVEKVPLCIVGNKSDLEVQRYSDICSILRMTRHTNNLLSPCSVEPSSARKEKHSLPNSDVHSLKHQPSTMTMSQMPSS